MTRHVKSEAGRVAVASAIGTTIEWYDFFIYGTAAAVVFGPQFFPQIPESAGRLAAFATFGLGFLARPLGSIVMGHFGDRVGRKTMLVWSLMLMGIATFSIGLLPNYTRIGIWAPTLLTVCRFVQGFALGGEWGGAVLLSVEHAPAGRRGFFGSMVALGLPAGIILSNLVFLVVSVAVAPATFAAWGWRIPFFASGALVIVGLFVRASVAESPVFDAALRIGSTRAMPVLDILKRHGRAATLAAGSYVASSALGYIVLVFFVSYATRELDIPLQTALMLLLIAALVFAASIVTCARWSDRVGRRRIMRWGSGGLVLWCLIFFPLLETRSIPLIGLALCGNLLLQGAYIGTQPAVFAELFPTEVRCSGVSLSFTLATIVGGAPAPLIATALLSAGGSALVTAYITALSLLSWLCLFGLRETHRTNIVPPRG